MSLGSDEPVRDLSHTLTEAIDPLPEVIALLEERLVVRSDKRMAGEIVVRKEIGTRIVEVPIRYEKLIVEQVNPTYQQIAVIDLDQVNGNAHSHPKANQTVTAEFDSPRAASDVLDAIARTPLHGCESIRIEVVLKDSQHQETYESWFDRCGKSKS